MSRQLFYICLFLLLTSLSTAQSNKELGESFLIENRSSSGVQTLESGLQYKLLKLGSDTKAQPRDKVIVHYQGKHLDGTVFDSTFGGEPAELKLSRTIKGWREGIPLIGEGGRIVLFVPSNLAYGRRGAPPTIDRNETLVFIIELQKVIPR